MMAPTVNNRGNRFSTAGLRSGSADRSEREEQRTLNSSPSSNYRAPGLIAVASLKQHRPPLLTGCSPVFKYPLH